MRLACLSAFSVPKVRLMPSHPHLQPQHRPSSTTVQQRQEVEQQPATLMRQLAGPG